MISWSRKWFYFSNILVCLLSAVLNTFHTMVFNWIRPTLLEANVSLCLTSDTGTRRNTYETSPVACPINLMNFFRETQRGHGRDTAHGINTYGDTAVVKYAIFKKKYLGAKCVLLKIFWINSVTWCMYDACLYILKLHLIHSTIFPLYLLILACPPVVFVFPSPFCKKSRVPCLCLYPWP